MLVLADLSARIADAHVLVLQKNPKTKSSRGTASPRTHVLQGLFHLLKLLSFLFFQSYFVGIFSLIFKTFMSLFLKRKLLVRNSAACSVLHVSQPHDHSSHF